MTNVKRMQIKLPVADVNKAAQTDSIKTKPIFSGDISLLKLFWWQRKQIGRKIFFFIDSVGKLAKDGTEGGGVCVPEKVKFPHFRTIGKKKNRTKNSL